ncbi:transposable element gene, partial [Prunus dulcis]
FFATALTTITEADTPSHFKAAGSQKALQLQGTWILALPPVDKNIVSCKWIYKIKRHVNGSISRYKARLVPRGLAAAFKWELTQLDVKNAFLHDELQEEVYMQQPQGFKDSTRPEFVCKLLKSLYGLKQAPRAWNAKFTSYLPSLSFQVSHSDPSLFIKKTATDLVILLLYVDDIIIIGSNAILIQTVIDSLAEVFDMKDIGKLTHFLGLQVQYQDNGTYLIKRVGMDTCKPCSTPCKPHQQLLHNDVVALSDPTLYGSLVDIAYAINTVCQFMTQPTNLHMCHVKHISNISKAHFNMVLAYSQGSMADDPNTQRSTIGYVVFLGHNPISWSSKKQALVSRCSTEAEYKALAHCAPNISWIRQLLCDLHISIPKAPILTKGKHNPLFHNYCSNLRLGPSPAEIKGG